MKKIAILFFILFLILSGCSKKEEPAQTQEPSLSQENGTEESGEEIRSEEQDVNDAEAESLLAEAAQGKFTGLDISFNDPLDRVINVLGDPDEISSWQGADLYIYNNLGIYIDPYDELVTGLTAGAGYETYGIEIGMQADLVKSILGEPDFEGESYESGVQTMEYRTGEYLVEIVVDQESDKTLGITLYSYMN